MKSQPDIKIRRLAVFGGYGDLEAETAWSRLDIRRRAEDPATGAQPEVSVIQLDARPRTADLSVAA